MTPFVSIVAHAEDLDTIERGQEQYNNEQKQQDEKSYGSTVDSITDYMSGHENLTGKDMAKAENILSPVTNLIGYAIGIVVVLTTTLVGLVTALDLMYIAIPVVRPLLHKEQPQQVGGMMGGMPGRMPMGGQPQQSGHKFTLISDECLACVAESGAQQAGGMGGGMPGRPGMMGGPGMMGRPGMMGGPGMMGAQQEPPKTKSVIFMYLKKRIFFLILFSVALIVLLSSVFTDCGINIAKLFFKVFGLVNGGIENIEVG